MLTFMRNFTPAMMELWGEQGQIASSISFTEDVDSLIWQLDIKGDSTSSLYHVINFRGVVPIFILALWGLALPPRIHIFLWLLSQGKFMTRDNLKKRHLNKPEDCLFCSEQESIQHLFFDCVVASNTWSLIAEFFHIRIGSNYESAARFWVSNKKNQL
jgi:hypothetical protein